MMQASGKTLTVTGALKGGEVFSGHADTSTTRNAISQGNYDAVVLQGGSYESIYDQDNFFEYGSELAQLSLTSGKAPIFFMTWHHRATPNESPLIQHAYEDIGERNAAPVVPVGLAFQATVDAHPDINLFSDGTHSSLEGTYLAAAVFYAFINQTSPEDITYNAGLNEDIAATLRSVAWDTVSQYNLESNNTETITINSVSPQNNSSDVGPEQILEIHFSENVAADVFDISLQLQSGNNVINGDMRIDNNRLMFTPTKSLASDSLYIVSVRNGDQALRWIEEREWQFQTRAASPSTPTLENNKKIGYQAWSTMWNEFGSNNEWGSASGIPDNRRGSVHKLVGRMYTSLGINGYVDDFTFLPQGSGNIDGPEAMAAIDDTDSSIYVISSYGGSSGICEYPTVAANPGGWHQRVSATANAITNAGMHPVFFQSHCNGDKKDLWKNMKENSDAVEAANPNMGIVRTAEVIEHLVNLYPEYGELQAFDPRGAQYPPPIEVLFSSDGFHGTMALHFLLSLTLTKYLTGVDAVDIPFSPDLYYEIPNKMIERIRHSVDAVQTTSLAN